MFLQVKNSADVIEIENIEELINPNQDTVQGRDQLGQNEQGVKPYKKEELVFPSGEDLPRCWINPNYRQEQSAA